MVIIGSSNNDPVPNTITGSSNEVTVTNGPGTISLTLPQQIGTTSSVNFSTVNASSLIYAPTVAASTEMNTPYINIQNTEYQVNFTQNSGKLTTINVPETSSSSAIYNIPDVGATGDFLLTTGNQTITGTMSHWNSNSRRVY